MLCSVCLKTLSLFLNLPFIKTTHVAVIHPIMNARIHLISQLSKGVNDDTRKDV